MINLNTNNEDKSETSKLSYSTCEVILPIKNAMSIMGLCKQIPQCTDIAV